MASVWFGRNVGLLSGCVLATFYEFHHYAIAPESDIFVCTLVVIGMALFVHLEFQRTDDTSASLFGPRPLSVLALFVVLGLGNVVKGLYFADLHMLAPIAAFLLWRPWPWQSVRRYVWLPGWLVFVVVGTAWALAAYARHPDIVHLWTSDYQGRLMGWLAEPWWYYAANLPICLLPWTPLALLGLWLTRDKALFEARSPERFLWCWAIMPVLVLSIPQGKHHHYLLSTMAPWAVLAAVAGVRVHEWVARQSLGVITLIAGVIGEVALIAVAYKVQGVAAWVPLMLVGWPAGCAAVWLASCQADAMRAMAVLLAAAVLLYWGKEHPEWVQQRGHRADLALLEEAKKLTPANCPVLVLDTWGPLDPSWSMYHLMGRGRMLHNITFLRDDRLPEGDLYVLSRPMHVQAAGQLGRVEELARSSFSRGEKEPSQRLILYRIRLFPHVARLPGDVYISPMQATGRALGPVLR
jgi:4-amino-4-deoxy-L-arabinose transferase-like glycosyltransferase